MIDAMTQALATGLAAEYAEVVDGRDPDRLRDLLAPRVRLTRAGGTVEGADEFLEAYRPFLESAIRASRHTISNVRGSRTDQGVRVEAYFQAYMFDTDRTRVVFGRYDDEWIEVEGRWSITYKRNTIDWTIDLPAATAP